MADNEIIKAFGCCLLTYSKECEKCPYEKHKPYVISTKTCSDKMRKDALDLINRQKAEVKSLKEKAKRWKENYESQQVVVGDFREIIHKQAEELKTAKAKAVKEFADRLHDEVFIMSRTPEGDIDFNDFEVLLRKIQKETVGDE